MQYFHSTVITELVLLLEKVMKVLQEQAFLVCFIKAHNSNYVCEHIQGALVSNVLKFAYTPWPSLLCFHSDAVIIHFRCKSSIFAQSLKQ